MMKCIKKTLLFFSCFAWTQPLLSLSTLSLWQNINKRNNQEFLDKTPKKQKRDTDGTSSTSLTNQRETDCSKNTYECNLDNSRVLQCDFLNCKKTFPTLWMLNQHKQIHITGKTNFCFSCKSSFKSPDYLSHHQSLSHNPKHPFKCQYCSFTFSDKQLADNHLKTHTQKIPCLFCISHPSYATPKNLHRHINARHSYYKCKYKDCNKTFILGSLLHQHILEQHGFSSIQCLKCSQSFHGLFSLYQHNYIKHKKCDKNTFIQFLKDFIEKNFRCSYPSYLQHPFFKALFLEKEVLINRILSNLKTKTRIDGSAIPIETLHLYKQFIEKITLKTNPPLDQLSLDVLLSYECYRLYLFYGDSAIELLLLKEILSIMIQISNPLRNPLRNPLKTNYKEMLDRLYTNQFNDEEYLLLIQQLKKIFSNQKLTTARQIKILAIISHDPNNSFHCQYCSLTFSDEVSVDEHLMIHRQAFSCSFCIPAPTYHSQAELNRHRKMNHSYYKCKDKDCNESFILGSLFFQHIEKQHGFPSLPCPECPQFFHGLLTLYQHKYIEHKKCDKNTFIQFLKDFIEKHLRCDYPSYLDHPFFQSLFLDRQVLIDTLLFNLETKTDVSAIPIETLPLYEDFVEKITLSHTSADFNELSLDALLFYECYRLYLSGDDSAMGLLLLKKILSIMIQIRKPLTTDYKEMLDILYTKDTKDTNEFSDQEFLLFIQQFKNIFFNEKRSTSEEIKIVEPNSLNKSA